MRLRVTIQAKTMHVSGVETRAAVGLSKGAMANPISPMNSIGAAWATNVSSTSCHSATRRTEPTASTAVFERAKRAIRLAARGWAFAVAGRAREEINFACHP